MTKEFVRRARNIDAISLHIEEYCEKAKVSSIDELVKLGRDLHYQSKGPHYVNWSGMFLHILEEANYLRDDINHRTFLVGKFYKKLYFYLGKRSDNVFCSYDELRTNEQYESCQYVTDEWFYMLNRYLERHLSDRETSIVRLRYGFYDGLIWNYWQIGDSFGLTGPEIRQIERLGLHKLEKSGFPPLAYLLLSN